MFETFLKISDYIDIVEKDIQKEYDLKKYLHSFEFKEEQSKGEKNIITGMIKLKSPDFLAGPFYNGYGIIQIIDYSEAIIESEDLIKSRAREHSEYSKYNFPHKYMSKVSNVTYKGQICSRGEVTIKEKKEFLLQMTPEEIETYERKKEIDFQRLFNEWINTTPHKEKPIKIYIAGNDDFSTTCLCETVEEALSIFEELKDEKKDSLKIIEEKFTFSN